MQDKNRFGDVRLVSSIIMDTVTVESITNCILSGLLTGAISDVEVAIMFSEGEYSTNSRRSLPPNDLSGMLSRTVLEYITENQSSKEKIIATSGVCEISADCPDCLLAIIVSTNYLIKLEQSCDCPGVVNYLYACPISTDFQNLMLSSNNEGNRTNQILINIQNNSEKRYCSTLQNTANEQPLFPLGNVCGLYERERIVGNGCDGGLRTMGMYKTDSDALPLITFITVVYNRKDVLWRCMESVFNQNYSNIEYIVVDGASTDGTLDLIKRHGNKIDYYVSQPDSGLYNAMNRGLRLATGRLICFMNSDDYCLPNAASTVARVYKETYADAISGHQELLGPSGAKGKTGVKRFHIRNCVLYYTQMYHQALYTSRHAFEGVGYFDESYRIIADAIHGSKILGNPEYTTVFIEDTLAAFYQYGISHSNRTQTEKEFLRSICETFSYISLDDAEILYLCLRHYDFPPYHYCNYYTLTKIAKKYFAYPEFKRAYYETAIRSCLYFAFGWGRELKFDIKWEKSELFAGYPAITTRQKYEALSRKLEEHCALNYVLVSDNEIYELCRFQNDYIKAWHKYYLKDSKGTLGKLKVFIHLCKARLTAKSIILTLKSVRNYGRM